MGGKSRGRGRESWVVAEPNHVAWLRGAASAPFPRARRACVCVSTAARRRRRGFLSLCLLVERGRGRGGGKKRKLREEEGSRNWLPARRKLRFLQEAKSTIDSNG